MIKKRKKKRERREQHMKKGIFQQKDGTPECWLLLEHWSTSGENIGITQKYNLASE